MATGEDPARMSHRRFMFALANAMAVRQWLDGKGDLPDLFPAPEPDVRAIGL